MTDRLMNRQEALRRAAQYMARQLLDGVSYQVRSSLVITMPTGGLTIGGTSSLIENCTFLEWDRLSPRLQNELIREGAVVAAVQAGQFIVGAPTREAVRDSLAYKLARRNGRAC